MTIRELRNLISAVILWSSGLTACTQTDRPNEGPPTASARAASSSAAEATKFIRMPEQMRRRTVPLVALLANPEQHRGVDITVYGYFARDWEPPLGNLFLDRESALHGILPNSIHVTLERCRAVSMPEPTPDQIQADELKSTRDGYVLVQGVFEPYSRGPQVGAVCAVSNMVVRHELETMSKKGPDGGSEEGQGP